MIVVEVEVVAVCVDSVAAAVAPEQGFLVKVAVSEVKHA